MEVKNINYSFIAVPTQLFILLDYRLKLVLTSLIQASTALANSNGWFYYSKEDLKKLCGIKNDKTIIACLETFYRLNLLEVQARTFKNNVGSRTANYYRINFNEIEKYNEYSVYECMNIPELQIQMLDYTSSDYQTTYTAATDNNSSNEESIPEPTDVQNNVNEEIPTSDLENAPTALKTASNENEQYYTVSEVDENVVFDAFGNDITEEWNDLVEQSKHHDIKDEWQEPKDELDEILGEDSETELEQAEEPIVETASVFSVDLPRVEKRSLRQENLDEAVKQKLFDLLERYKAMTIARSDEAFEKCNDACRYVKRQYDQGFIDFETKDRLIRDFVNARFEKFII